MPAKSTLEPGERITASDPRLWNINDLAAILGVNRAFIRRMKFAGFQMPGGKASVKMAHRFIEQNPAIPTSQLSKKKQKELSS